MSNFRARDYLTNGLNRRNSRVVSAGFSLVEVAVVLLIVGLLISGLLSPLSHQREQVRLSQSGSEADTILAAIAGFAASQGRLPCPATDSSAGQESVVGSPPTACVTQHGFVPAATLGITGSFTDAGLLMDPWNNPWRYSVTATDSDADNIWDFIGEGEMSERTMGELRPNLVVCDAASNSNTSCSDGNMLVSNAVVVLLSMGKDWGSYSSASQQENAGEGTGATLGNYPIAGTDDLVFVSQDASVSVGNEFDDQVFWLSPNLLYTHMIKAGQLP